MNGIPAATPIRLTEEERAELLSLARSTRTEYRMRQRARIVLLAAEAWPAARSAAKLVAPPERPRSGGGALRAPPPPGGARQRPPRPHPKNEGGAARRARRSP